MKLYLIEQHFDDLEHRIREHRAPSHWPLRLLLLWTLVGMFYEAERLIHAGAWSAVPRNVRGVLAARYARLEGVKFEDAARIFHVHVGLLTPAWQAMYPNEPARQRRAFIKLTAMERLLTAKGSTS